MHAQISFQKRVTNNVASKLRNGALLSPSQRTANVIQTSHKEIKKVDLPHVVDGSRKRNVSKNDRKWGAFKTEMRNHWNMNTCNICPAY